ncbi:MAG: T9SS type A sorting domain-containing protein [Cytophagaceae bacterium]|jgi:uncharacterized repeat protein (TIGR03803 family)|nr:T9SS type A sorting domain-containing protein [Cytophagaceae bacterium]
MNITKLILILCGFFAFAQNPSLWGISYNGGEDNAGTLFKMSFDGTQKSLKHSFRRNVGYNPQNNNVIEISPNLFVSAAYKGGKDDAGVLFSVNASTYEYTKLHEFDGANTGANPTGLMRHSNGKLYGVTNTGGQHGFGVLYEYDLITHTFEKLLDFDQTTMGGQLITPPIEAPNGHLYGTALASGFNASAHGTLYKYNISTMEFTKLLDLDPLTTGSIPTAPFMLASNGKLYTTANAGGANNFGTILELDPANDLVNKIFDFDGIQAGLPQKALLEASNGKWYGISTYGGVNSHGQVFEYDPILNSITQQYSLNGTVDGQNPISALSEGQPGVLFGLTNIGGANDMGTLFKITTASFTFSKLIDLGDVTYKNNILVYGRLPENADMLKTSDGKLIAMFKFGGVADEGAMLAYDINTNEFESVMDFDKSIKGHKPTNMILLNNKFYGTTFSGGKNSGVLFEYDPVNNEYIKKSDLQNPSNLTSYLYSYGITAVPGNRIVGAGDEGNKQVIYSYDLNTNQFSILASTTEGRLVFNNVYLAADGKLYGMTSRGGAQDMGILYSFNLTTNTITKLRDFDGAALGSMPTYTGFVETSNGTLYGTTNKGGSSDKGVLFEYVPSTNTFTKKVDFDGTNGASPTGSMVRHSNGKFYGLTIRGGSENSGVLYEYTPGSTSVTNLLNFGTSTFYCSPTGSLSLASNGKLYGYATSNSFPSFVFEFDPVSNTFTKRMDLSEVGANIPMNTMLLEASICSNTTHSFSVNACESYTSPSGKIWQTSQVYKDTIANAEGCDSIMTIDLTITDINTALAISGSSISAIEAGATYQWIDCDQSGINIDGATNRTYTLQTPSSAYVAVKIDKNGCMKISDCETIVLAGLTDAEGTNRWQLYPNPTLDRSVLSFHEDGTYSVWLKDVWGNTLQQHQVRNQSSLELYLKEPGVYFVEIQDENQQRQYIKLLRN